MSFPTYVGNSANYASNNGTNPKFLNSNFHLPSNVTLKGEMHSRRKRNAKNPGAYVRRRIPVVKCDLDPDLNRCAAVNQRVGKDTAKNGGWVYESSQELQRCADKGKVLRYKCDSKPKGCEELQTAPKAYNECDLLNLKAGENGGKFARPDDLIKCMPRDGNNYQSEERPKTGCVFGNFNENDGSPLGMGLFCIRLSTAPMPFRVGGKLIPGSRFFVPTP